MAESAAKSRFEVIFEGHGGDRTAPSPLAYFTNGLTACMMTQIRWVEV
jgi:uncharacterized OsmC-like protein